MEPKVNKALVLDDGGSEIPLLIQRLMALGFLCALARSFHEAKARLSTEVFDVVLSKFSINGGTAYDLQSLLMGRPTSLFYSLAIDEGSWWIPAIRQGKECVGEPALRPDAFFSDLVRSLHGPIEQI